MDASANYLDMQPHIKQLIDDKEIDCIMCYQPSYVRDSQGSSLINHCFKLEVSPEFALNMGGSDYFQIVPPVGSVSLEQAKLQVIDSITHKSFDIPPHHYFFQKGDLYYLCKNDSNGTYFNELGSPAPSITKHAVFASLNKQSFTLMPKTVPAYDDLTLV